MLPPVTSPFAAIVCRLLAEDAASPELKESLKIDPMLVASFEPDTAVPWTLFNGAGVTTGPGMAALLVILLTIGTLVPVATPE